MQPLEFIALVGRGKPVPYHILITIIKKRSTSCSANSPFAPNSNLTMINSDTLMEHMEGSGRECFALWLHGLSNGKDSGRTGVKGERNYGMITADRVSLS